MTFTTLALIAFGIIHIHVNREDSSLQVLNQLEANDHHYMKRPPNLFTLIYEGSWLKKLAFPIRSPKLLGMYAGGWSKKLKVASKFTKDPITKFYYQFSSVFDKGVAKLFLTVPKVIPPIGK